jgi:hypothetical protein
LWQSATLSNNNDISSNLYQEDLVKSQLKQISNKEDKERRFLILRLHIKGATNPVSIIRSQMARIDLTLEDGIVLAKTTKEGMEKNFLEKNPKAYRATGITPFGDSYPG